MPHVSLGFAAITIPTPRTYGQWGVVRGEGRQAGQAGADGKNKPRGNWRGMGHSAGCRREQQGRAGRRKEREQMHAQGIAAPKGICRKKHGELADMYTYVSGSCMADILKRAVVAWQRHLGHWVIGRFSVAKQF